MSREAVYHRRRNSGADITPAAMGYVFRAWRDREEVPFQRLHPVAKEENKNKVSLEGVARKYREMGMV